MNEEKRRRGEDDFLSAENAEGETLDFHSLRHTCGAWMILAGENIKVVQSVMRHATIQLTVDTYGHLLDGQESGAVHKITAVMNGALVRPDVLGTKLGTKATA